MFSSPNVTTRLLNNEDKKIEQSSQRNYFIKTMLTRGINDSIKEFLETKEEFGLQSVSKELLTTKIPAYKWYYLKKAFDKVSTLACINYLRKKNCSAAELEENDYKTSFFTDKDRIGDYPCFPPPESITTCCHASAALIRCSCVTTCSVVDCCVRPSAATCCFFVGAIKDYPLRNIQNKKIAAPARQEM